VSQLIQQSKQLCFWRFFQNDQFILIKNDFEIIVVHSIQPFRAVMNPKGWSFCGFAV